MAKQKTTPTTKKLTKEEARKIAAGRGIKRDDTKKPKVVTID